MLNADKPLQPTEGVRVHTCARGWLCKGIRVFRVFLSSPYVLQHARIYVGIVQFLHRNQTSIYLSRHVTQKNGIREQWSFTEYTCLWKQLCKHYGRN